MSRNSSGICFSICNLSIEPVFRCQGKLLQGSGPDDALIEYAMFVPSVIELVLHPGALIGMQIV